METQDFKELSIAQLVEKFAEAKQRLVEAKDVSTQAQKEFDFFRFVVLPERMDEENIDNIKTSFGSVSVSSDLRASILAENREIARDWLEAAGYGDLVKPTVNASSLKALAKELLLEGQQLPPDIFNIVPFTRANLRK